MLFVCMLEWQCRSKTESLLQDKQSSACVLLMSALQSWENGCSVGNRVQRGQGVLSRMSPLGQWCGYVILVNAARSIVNIGNIWVCRWTSSFSFYSSKVRRESVLMQLQMIMFLFTWSLGGAMFSSVYAILRPLWMQTPQVWVADRCAPSMMCCWEQHLKRDCFPRQNLSQEYLHSIGRSY